MARNIQNTNMSREEQAQVIAAIAQANAEVITHVETETIPVEVIAQDVTVNAVETSDTNETVNEVETPSDTVEIVPSDEIVPDGSDGEPDETETSNSDVTVSATLDMSDIESDDIAGEGVTAKTFAAVAFRGEKLIMFSPFTKIKPAYNAAITAVKSLREKNVDMRRNPAEFRNVGRNWVGYDKNKTLVLVEVRDVTGQTSKEQTPMPVKPTYISKA